MSHDRMLKQAFAAILRGDAQERDRLCAQVERNRRDPWANLSTETDKAMAHEVTKLSVEFTKMLQLHCPGLFSGDARDTAVATLALAETFGGVVAATKMHGDDRRVRAVTDLFKDRAGQAVAGIGDRVAGGRQ